MGVFEEVAPGAAEEWSRLLSRVYSHAEPEEPPQPIEAGERRFVVRDGGRATAACRVRAYTVARGDCDVPCGGVAAVGTLVEARRKGHTTVLMRGVLEAMRRAGQPLAALYPFQGSFYAQFGYGSSGWQFEIACPRACLPSLPAPAVAGTAGASEWGRLVPAYDAFIRRRSGNLVRRPEDWARRLEGEGKEVFTVGEPVRGYCVVRAQGFWNPVEVLELVYADSDAYEALLGLFVGLCANQDEVRWNEPPDSAFVHHHMSRGVVAVRGGATMFRVVDAPAALGALRPEGSGRFTVGVEDEAAPWNAGAWTLSWRDGCVAVEAGGEPGFTLCAPALAQAFMGSPSLETLAWHGRVAVHDVPQFEAGKRFFGSWPVSMLDTF